MEWRCCAVCAAHTIILCCPARLSVHSYILSVSPITLSLLLQTHELLPIIHHTQFLSPLFLAFVLVSIITIQTHAWNYCCAQATPCELRQSHRVISREAAYAEPAFPARTNQKIRARDEPQVPLSLRRGIPSSPFTAHVGYTLLHLTTPSKATQHHQGANSSLPEQPGAAATTGPPGLEMDALKQSIAEIDSAIIEARQWVREARTDEDTRERQMQLDKLESDLINQQAKLDARMLEEEKKSR